NRPRTPTSNHKTVCRLPQPYCLCSVWWGWPAAASAFWFANFVDSALRSILQCKKASQYGALFCSSPQVLLSSPFTAAKRNSREPGTSEYHPGTAPRDGLLGCAVV